MRFSTHILRMLLRINTFQEKNAFDFFDDFVCFFQKVSIALFPAKPRNTFRVFEKQEKTSILAQSEAPFDAKYFEKAAEKRNIKNHNPFICVCRTS